MDWYSIVKLLHVISAVVWVGGGLMLAIMGTRAAMSGDMQATALAMKTTGDMGGRVMMPASLLTLVFGLILCWFWVGFSELWIVIGLVGYFVTFLVGTLVFKPAGDRMAASIARNGVTPALMVDGNRILRVARFDYAVMMVIVTDMVLKPTPDDVGVLAAMAVILIAGAIAAFVNLTGPALAES